MILHRSEFSDWHRLDPRLPLITLLITDIHSLVLSAPGFDAAPPLAGALGLAEGTRWPAETAPSPGSEPSVEREARRTLTRFTLHA